MSSLKVEERFVVDADVLRVWEFLKRPALVAGCLPGAKLDGQEGGDTFLGTMKVKVGPVMQDFRGKATLAEVDDTLHKMTVSGVGDDKAGGGSARMTMQCQVVPSSETGKSEVTIVAEVELFGKLVRFGRGMFEAVAKQLFKQFVDRARSAIASMPAPAGSSEPAVVLATPLPATSTGTSEASTRTSEASTRTSEASKPTSEASKPTSEASAASSEASKPTSEA
ncbi:MAG TPA: SRPBCC domain-containing protein, partial [Pseudomonadota bacterium]|nr:SRPBCC domain-containing protein [Pseudomonadota bacterium]